jgi:GT2 family glycosyltransferase
MGPRVDLVLLGERPEPVWALGAVVAVGDRTPAALDAAVRSHLAHHRPDALLHWDGRLGPPPPYAAELLSEPDDVWHAGLLLGLGGSPSWIDLVAPTWMLNADPAPDRPATSWRLSLEACLVRTSVVEDLGHLEPGFATLDGAGLELGHRWVSGGALCRHEPRLRPASPSPHRPIPEEDQQRFVHRRFGPAWATYATLRSPHRVRNLRRLRSLGREPVVRPGHHPRPPPAPASPDAGRRVSVIIPTVDRYPWLERVLADLAAQTVPPGEVLVVDQTPSARRRPVTAGAPVRVIESEVVGQCTARNRALTEAAGDLLLFLDDDDEVPPDLVERHLARLEHLDVDACSGGATEPGQSGPDPSFARFRQSDVFPTNNTMLRRRALADSGLFDLAYDHGERADHDLGMRLYLAGRRLVLDPGIEVLHHHAPRGGLRTHAARVRTYRASRSSTVDRHHLAPTEVYLWRRYFRPDQVREAMRLRLLGTFSRRGTWWQRTLRVLVQLVLLPGTVRRLRQAEAAAVDLGREHPTIPRPAPTADR